MRVYLKYLGDGQRRAPIIFQDIQANSSLVVNVAMVNLGGETDLGRLEGIFCRELDIQAKNTTSIRAPPWPHDRCTPPEQIALRRRPGAAVGRRVLGQVFQLFLNSLQRHFCVGGRS